MGRKLANALLVTLAPLLLIGCVLTPGKFTSTMTINADRTFAFTYVGEVFAIDPAKELKDIGDGKDEDGTAKDTDKASEDATPSSLVPQASSDAGKPEDTEAKNRAIAEALRKEAGYRKVEYVGKGKFLIDYAIKGRLDHNFIYPFNVDAEAVFPFIAVEVRANGTVRAQAPAFGKGQSKGPAGGMGGDDAAAALREGTFTLDTDAEIVSQNNEDGVTKASGRQRIVWKVTPTTSAAPMAVLRMK